MVRLLSSNPDVPEDEDCGEFVPGAARGLLTEARVQRPEPQPAETASDGKLPVLVVSLFRQNARRDRQTGHPCSGSMLGGAFA